MTAVICGTPIPATILVVQIDPGPIPTLKAMAPASISAFAPAAVATFPEIRGMGSVAAMKDGSSSRYGQEYRKGQERKLVAEGVEGAVPFAGSAEDVVNQLIGGLRSGMYYAGVKNITDLQENSRLMKITQASLIESHPHDIISVKR